MTTIKDLLTSRRFIFLGLMISLAIPLGIAPLGLPVRVTEQSKIMFDTIEDLGSDDIIVFAVQSSMSTWSEEGPPIMALIRHLFAKDIKTVFVSFAPEGSLMIENALSKTGTSDQTYGEDYVQLAYIPGGESGMAAFLESPRGTVTLDYFGQPISELQLMQEIDDGHDFALSIIVESGDIYKEVRQFWASWNLPMGIISTAGWFAMNLAYSGSAGLVSAGMLNGLRGGAEYEQLLGQPATGTVYMDALSLGILFTVVYIIYGNVEMYMKKTKKGKEI